MLIEIVYDDENKQAEHTKDNCVTALICACKTCEIAIECADGCKRCVRHGSTATIGRCKDQVLVKR